MPNFQYIAQNEEGKSLKGILLSDSERSARQEIKSKNLLLLSIKETSKQQLVFQLILDFQT